MSVGIGDLASLRRTEAACIELLTVQGISMSSSLITRHIADGRKGPDASTIAWVLRNSDRVRQSSPGMYRVAPAHVYQRLGELMEPQLDSGAVLAGEMEASPPIDVEAQLRLFMRLQALRRLASFASVSLAYEVLQRTVDQTVDRVLVSQSWTLLDLMDHAIGVRRLLPVEDPSTEGGRHELLVALLAIELIPKYPFAAVEQVASEIRERLLISNLRLVSQHARRYSRGGFMRLGDLFQEAFIGLMRAVDLFDPYKGYLFSTYATWWIRQAITRAIADQERVVRLPVHVVEKVNAVERASRQVLAGGGSDTAIEIARLLGGVSEQEVALFLRLRPSPTYLDYVWAPSGDDAAVDEGCRLVELRICLSSVLNELTSAQRVTLALRFGLADGIDRTLQEVGDILGVTRERARQVESTSLKRLRGMLPRSGLDEFVDRGRVSTVPPSADAKIAASDEDRMRKAREDWWVRLSDGRGLPRLEQPRTILVMPTAAALSNQRAVPYRVYDAYSFGWSPADGWIEAPLFLARRIRQAINSQRSKIIRDIPLSERWGHVKEG
jgi:RNA polymerase sigma factor (sigma-70 family)